MKMNLEQAQEVRNSSLWKYISDELDYRILSKTSELMTCSLTKIESLRDIIKTLEEIKRLPDDVVDREKES